MAYLLVPPAVLGAFAVAVARRGRGVPTPVLLVGVVLAVQMLVYFLLQFVGTVQTLEQHYLSSTLWSGVCLASAITIAELARPLCGRPFARWLPAAVLLVIPLGYEAYPHVPSFGWLPFGAILAAGVIVAAVAASGAARLRHPLAAATAIGLALAAFAGAALVLTVAPIPVHPRLPNTHPGSDPAPAYSTALGGSGTIYIDGYRIATALPAFVGPAAYRGEQLLIWRLTPGPSEYLSYAVGMYHDGYNKLQQLLAEPHPVRPPEAHEQAAGRAAAGRRVGGVVSHGPAPSVRLPASLDARRGAARRPLGPASLAHPARCLLPSAAPRRLGSPAATHQPHQGDVLST